ncbi:hemagglutinin repeat-containing protein [Pseudomonas sp. F3-2]|uniref:hemagglutinin repeat-containing protein n=1 Tax=Pseudomonas sp. F3-2 TaxID=3141539 RepID=UPI00315D70FA
MVNSLVLNRKHTSSDVTQISATVSIGRDLSVQAGRDVNAIATQIDAKRDIAIAATENVTIASAADEDHFLSKSKKLTVQEDHVHQVWTEINAGGSVAVSAGQNLAVISSRITAGDEAYLVAGDKLDILAAQDSDYSLYNKKSKGSFGRKKTKRNKRCWQLGYLAPSQVLKQLLALGMLLQLKHQKPYPKSLMIYWSFLRQRLKTVLPGPAMYTYLTRRHLK